MPKFTVRQVVTLLAALPCTLSQLAEICDEIEQQVKVRQREKVKQQKPKLN
ncbi:MAG: hypothetical protein HC820_00990 [Hydrococcus sp. RM1_1_31]|nr:hypothetical protein [Hydrococcus sp. RM1_1_31]